MSLYDDGGPTFPVQDSATWQAHGLSKRELFAAILMHSEAVTCGVPGEACEALIEASSAAGTDVIDHMAMNAVQGADALLRALGHVPAPQYRNLHADEQAKVDAADDLAAVVLEIVKRADFPVLPDDLRQRLDQAVEEVIEPSIPF